MEMIPVKDVANLYRDENGILHNCDKDGFNAYIEHRNKILSDKERIANLESDVKEIKSSIGQILALLQGK